jgi:multiple sugar transport system permease protein
VVILVTFYPVAYAFYLSVYRTTFAKIQAYVGLGNFITLLHDSSLLRSIGRTLVFVFVSVFLSMGLGYAMALLLNRRCRDHGPALCARRPTGTLGHLSSLGAGGGD